MLLASSQAQAAIWDRAALTSLMATTVAGEQHYTETKELAFLEVPSVSQGRLLFFPPGRLVKQVEKPNPVRYEINGDRITVSRPGEPDQVVSLDAHPLLRTYIETLLAVLTGNFETLERHYEMELTGERSAWQLKLIPLNSQIAMVVKSLTIRGCGKQIEQIVTQEQGGDRSILTLHNCG